MTARRVVVNLPDGFAVDPEALADAARAIAGRLAPARDIDLAVVPADAAAYGAPGVSGSLTHFCNTWQLARSLLLRRAEAAAAGLTVESERYRSQDDALSATWRVLE